MRLSAASSVAGKPARKQLANTSESPTSLNINMPAAFIQRPASAEELRAWAAAISNKTEWSEASEVLMQYYHLHGFGITSRNSALR